MEKLNKILYSLQQVSQRATHNAKHRQHGSISPYNTVQEPRKYAMIQPEISGNFEKKLKHDMNAPSV